jgi:cytochrome c biogenesis protein CcmG, thiol:disulfide interchange protein DsbE
LEQMEEKNEKESMGGEVNTEAAKPTLRRRIANGLAYVAVFAAVLFFVAPESWWQFGVSPAAERKSAVNFTLNDINGDKWTLSDHRGKVVVVNYWATWCPPCRVETPGLVSFAEEYQPRGVEMVGVTVDEDISAVPPFAEQYKINYRILVEGLNLNLPVDGMALPTTFLYDKNGRLAKRYTGLVLESTLSSDVEALLAED